MPGEYAIRNAPGAHPPIGIAHLNVEKAMNNHGAIASLHNGEECFRQLFKNTRESIAVIQDEHIRFCTPSFTTMLGFSREELLSKGVSAFLHPDHRDHMLEGYSMCRAGEEASQRLEFKAVTKSGRTLWLQRAGALIEWEGEPAVLDFFTDITDRKLADQELRESRERLALALDIANAGVWDMQVETGMAQCNSVWFTMLGYGADDFHCGQSTWRRLVHPEDLPEAETAIRLHMQKGTPFEITFRMRTKSGDYRWISSRGHVVEKDLSGNAIRMIGTHLDITEQITAESALKESEERFKTFNDASSSGIIIHDKGIILDCNSMISSISGYAMDELIGMNGISLVAEESRDQVMQNMATGYEKPYEVVGLRRNGEKYPLHAEGRNILYKGDMVRVVEFRDMTEIQRVKEEQALLKARLEALWQVSRMVEADYASLCDLMLREVQTMTASEYSFFGYVEKGNESMTLQTWSPDAKAECAVDELTISFPIHKASLWSKAIHEQRRVMVNDYEQTTESKRGLPKGHIPIKRLLLIPIVRGGEVEALAAVANKSGKYTEEDASQMTAFVTNVMLLLERRTMEEELKASENKLSMALEMALMGQWELDLRTMTFTFNEQFYLIYGTSAQREGGMTMPAEAYARTFVHPDEIEVVATEISKILDGEYEEKRAQFEHRIRRRDGAVRHIVVRFAVINDESGRPVKAIGVNQDITLRKQAEQEMATQGRRLSDIIRGTNVGTWEWNIRTGETIFNERWADIIGYSLAELSPTSIETWFRFAHPDDVKASDELLKRHLQGDLEYFDCEARMKHKDGHWVWVLVRGKVSAWAEDGKPLFMSGTHQDITEKKRAEQQIHHLATHDMLTNLPSLRLAKDRIALAVSIAKRKRLLSAVLFIDLDGFKGVNDRFGHDAGDALLRETAKRLKGCVREVDTVARFAGDEFLVILTELKAREDAGLVAGKIVEAVRAPFSYLGNEIRVGASVGISVCDLSCAGVDIDRIIKKADEAMYRIKKSGKNDFAYADEPLRQS